MARRSNHTMQQLGVMALLCIVLFPLSVLLNEGGHWLVGRAAGFPTVLHYGSVSGIPELPPYGGAPFMVALAALAGPAVTLALALFGMANAGQRWGLPLVAVALPRFATNAVYMLQQAFVLAGIAEPSTPNFDEILAARALGLPPQPIAAVGALMLVFGTVWLWRRAGAKGFGVLLIGVIIGMVLWLGVLGPKLLP